MYRLLLILLLLPLLATARVTIKNDTFTEASDTGLESHTSDSGGGWQSSECNNIEVFSATDNISVDIGTGVTGCIGDEGPSETDYVCEATCTTGGTSSADRCGISVRAQDGASFSSSASSYYFIRVGGDASDQLWNFFRVDSGTPSTVGLSGTTSGTLSGTDTDDLLKLRITVTGIGATVTLVVEEDTDIDGGGFGGFAALTTITDTNVNRITTAGNPGVYMRNANVTLDDFFCEDLTGVVPIIVTQQRRRKQ